jgi:hypothetical protein
MSKISRTVFQKVSGEAVRILEHVEQAKGVALATAKDGRQAFTYAAPTRGGVYVPCRLPVEWFAHLYGVHEWHAEDPEGRDP